MNWKRKMLLKLLRNKKLSLNFDKDTVDLNNIERGMKIYVGRKRLWTD